MYRYQLPKQEVYLCQDINGLGDDIANLPVIKFILDKHPHVYITLWVKSYFKTLARKSLPETERLVIRTFSEKNEAKDNIPVKKMGGIPYTTLGTHPTIHCYDIWANTQPEDPNYYNYLPINLKGVYINRFNLPKNYVIVCTGYTAKVREFRPEIVNQLIEYILSKGYTPVFLGRESTPENSDATKVIKGNFSQEIQFDKGINLINQTDLLESTKIIKGAKCIVGLDNGLLHLAATTDVAIVGGYTTVRPEHRLPYRHGIKGWNYYPVTLTPEELPCVHCQSNWTFTYGFDFRMCYHTDYKCTELLVAQKYINELEKIL